MLRDYFIFSRRERTALMIVLGLLLALLVAPYFFEVNEPEPVVGKEIDSLVQAWQQPADSLRETGGTKDHFAGAARKELHPFPFDPNTLDADGWRRLGLEEKTVQTILHYRDKGGTFRSPEDLRRIWGISPADADLLVPFAHTAMASTYAPRYPIAQPEKKLSPGATVDINTATVEQLQRIPGMDRSMPYRIVKYRDKLGGFQTREQVKETYGMSDSIFSAILPYFSLSPPAIRKININIATEQEMARQPYLSVGIARAITIYRDQHGPYHSVSELRRIVFITEEMYRKMEGYLVVE